MAEIKSLDTNFSTEISEYTWGIVYEMSHIRFDMVSELINDICWQDCLEAYFFGDKKQMHLLREESGWKVYTNTSEGTDYVDRKYEIAGVFREVGKTVTVRNILSFDEDGQMIISGTQLVNVEG